MKYIFFIFVLIPFFSFAQVVEEFVQLDTIVETLKVIYQPEIKSSHYIKKVAVFAENTSQVAIEKSYTNYGQNGLYKVFYPNGSLKIKTVFSHNKIHGEWTYYDLEGIILIKGIYEEGIKDGYWAYKSLKTYGRYRKGQKHKKWKRKDESGNKYITHYKRGTLKLGKGFGIKIPSVLKLGKKKEKTVQMDTNSIAVVKKDTLSIDQEYEQAISFLTENWTFRKMLKNYLGTSIKKRAAVKKAFDRKEHFQFVVSSEVKALELTSFIKESEAGKIVVEKIDAILKKKSVELMQVFSGEEIKNNLNLRNNSTDKESFMEVVFSEVKHNLLRIDVNWMFKDEKSKFKILLYFDDEGVLKGAEYEKP
jgi:hypothetical protein